MIKKPKAKTLEIKGQKRFDFELAGKITEYTAERNNLIGGISVLKATIREQASRLPAGRRKLLSKEKKIAQNIRQMISRQRKREMQLAGLNEHIAYLSRK